jgi:hypothetical protein
MFPSPAALTIATYHLTHRRILDMAEKLTEAQLGWQAVPGSQTIAFHLWHITRWADHLQATIPGMTPELGQRLGSGQQIWEAEGLAARWGFQTAQLGYGATGMEMAGDIAATLSFPPKVELLRYLHQVFAAAGRAVDAIDDPQFAAAEQPQALTEGIWGESTVGDAILSHLVHENRHLGAIECLLGLQTGSGTATV